MNRISNYNLSFFFFFRCRVLLSSNRIRLFFTFLLAGYLFLSEGYFSFVLFLLRHNTILTNTNHQPSAMAMAIQRRTNELTD